VIYCKYIKIISSIWVTTYNKELHNFSPSIIRIIKSRRMRWAWHIARMRERWNAYRILVGKPEGRRPLGRPKLKSVKER
jgi:hypothetical protein